jgi:hypothetical protein
MSKTADGRNMTPFAKNVRSMNFFSIFVNNQVDEQMAEKLAESSSSAVFENLNKDEKESSTYNNNNQNNNTISLAKMQSRTKSE